MKEKMETEKLNIPELTETEYQIFVDKEIDDTELLDLMKEKGIEFDSGDIEIMVDGQKVKMSTEKNDFGTRRKQEQK